MLETFFCSVVIIYPFLLGLSGTSLLSRFCPMQLSCSDRFVDRNFAMGLSNALERKKTVMLSFTAPNELCSKITFMNQNRVLKFIQVTDSVFLALSSISALRKIE